MSSSSSTHTVDVLSASLGSEHRQNTGSASNLDRQQHSFRLSSRADKTEAFQLFRKEGVAHVKDDLVLEKVGVLLDGVSVGEGSDGVLEHLLVDTWLHVRPQEESRGKGQCSARLSGVAIG